MWETAFIVDSVKNRFMICQLDDVSNLHGIVAIPDVGTWLSRVDR